MIKLIWIILIFGFLSLPSSTAIVIQYSQDDPLMITNKLDLVDYSFSKPNSSLVGHFRFKTLLSSRSSSSPANHSSSYLIQAALVVCPSRLSSELHRMHTVSRCDPDNWVSWGCFSTLVNSSEKQLLNLTFSPDPSPLRYSVFLLNCLPQAFRPKLTNLAFMGQVTVKNGDDQLDMATAPLPILATSLLISCLIVFLVWMILICSFSQANSNYLYMVPYFVTILTLLTISLSATTLYWWIAFSSGKEFDLILLTPYFVYTYIFFPMLYVLPASIIMGVIPYLRIYWCFISVYFAPIFFAFALGYLQMAIFIWEPLRIGITLAIWIPYVVIFIVANVFVWKQWSGSDRSPGPIYSYFYSHRVSIWIKISYEVATLYLMIVPCFVNNFLGLIWPDFIDYYLWTSHLFDYGAFLLLLFIHTILVFSSKSFIAGDDFNDDLHQDDETNLSDEMNHQNEESNYDPNYENPDGNDHYNDQVESLNDSLNDSSSYSIERDEISIEEN